MRINACLVDVEQISQIDFHELSLEAPRRIGDSIDSQRISQTYFDGEVISGRRPLIKGISLALRGSRERSSLRPFGALAAGPSFAVALRGFPGQRLRANPAPGIAHRRLSELLQRASATKVVVPIPLREIWR